jgi:hypothetical protein
MANEIEYVDMKAICIKGKLWFDDIGFKINMIYKVTVKIDTYIIDDHNIIISLNEKEFNEYFIYLEEFIGNRNKKIDEILK